MDEFAQSVLNKYLFWQSCFYKIEIINEIKFSCNECNDTESDDSDCGSCGEENGDDD